MHVAVISLELLLPGCDSLKKKRSRLKPLIARLRREFNVSAAEVDHNDHLQSALIACAMVSNDARHLQRSLTVIPDWIERYWPDVQLVDSSLTTD
jgi:uncharacterized protein